MPTIHSGFIQKKTHNNFFYKYIIIIKRLIFKKYFFNKYIFKAFKTRFIKIDPYVSDLAATPSFGFRSQGTYQLALLTRIKFPFYKFDPKI